MYQRQSPTELIPTAKWQVRILLNALISKGVKVSPQDIKDAVAQLNGHVNWRAWAGESQQNYLTKRNPSHRLDREKIVQHTFMQKNLKKHNKDKRILLDDGTDIFDPH